MYQVNITFIMQFSMTLHSVCMAKLTTHGRFDVWSYFNINSCHYWVTNRYVGEGWPSDYLKLHLNADSKAFLTKA